MSIVPCPRSLRHMSTADSSKRSPRHPFAFDDWVERSAGRFLVRFIRQAHAGFFRTLVHLDQSEGSATGAVA